MKKSNVLWVILALVLLILFNAVFFIAGGADHPASVWISYGFIHFAYFLLVVTPYLIRGGADAAVFGFSLYSISAAYNIVEFLTGTIFILVAPEDYKAALLVQLVITGIYAIFLASHMIANVRTADIQEGRQPQLAYIKKASSEISSILDRVNDKQLIKKLKNIYDAISTSPVKTHPDVEQLEFQILSGINELRISCNAGRGDVAETRAEALLLLVVERNKRLRLLN